LLLLCSPPSSPPEWRARNPAIPAPRTNGNLPNPYRQVENWASPPRPWSPVNAVAVDPINNLWAVDRCETDDCVPVIELGPDGKTLKNFGASLPSSYRHRRVSSAPRRAAHPCSAICPRHPYPPKGRGRGGTLRRYLVRLLQPFGEAAVPDIVAAIKPFRPGKRP
jgi:hypothetical protein